MKRQANKITYTAMTLLLVIMLIFTFFVAGNGAETRAVASAAAASNSNVVAAYENQNVWTDLQSTKVDGEGLDLSIYNFDEKKQVQIISFVEFCYSYRTEKQGDFGLYVYVYNPRGYDFTQKPALNKITFRFTGKTNLNFEKKSLKYLNQSTQAGYEGLFYKFKIDLTEAERKQILETLNSTARVYEVSEIELYNTGTNATAYSISNVYTYTGYAKGYGSSAAENDTLNCKCAGMDVTLSLNPKSTFFMPEGTNGKKYTHDVLRSVYFAIPNDILNEFGALSAVHATWLNAKTNPMLVTGNSNYYNAFLKQVGKEIGSPATYEELSFLESFRTADSESDYYLGGYKFSGYLYGYNYPSKFGSTNIAKNITRLSGVFYAENGDADTWSVSSEEIVNWLKTYTQEQNVSSQFNVAGKYSQELFESWDSEFTEMNIHADYEYPSLTSEVIQPSWWDKLLRQSHKIENLSKSFDGIKAIVPVSSEEIEKYTKEKVCEEYYIDESDYDEFYQYCQQSKSEDKTVYLLRYCQSEHFSAEVCEGTWKRTWTPNTGGSIVSPGYVYSYKDSDTNAFLMQTWVQIDFDIIDVTCRKGDVQTVIGCVMSPMDITSDGRHPAQTTPDKDNGWDFWQWLLDLLQEGNVIAWICVIVVGLIVLTLLIKVLSLFVPIFVPVWDLLCKGIKKALSGVWRLFCLPFRGLKALSKKLKSRAAERKARKEKMRQVKLARKEAVQIAHYQNKLIHREQKYQDKVEAKDRQKAKKRAEKANEKAERRKTKAAEKAAKQKAKAAKKKQRPKKKSAKKKGKKK